MKLNPRIRQGLFLLIGLVGLSACEVRQWMYDDGRIKPYEESDFFPDGRSNRPLVEGTVARGYLNEDKMLHEGVDGSRIAAKFPFEITSEVLKRGQERFNIYCSACHGYSGRGNGMVIQRGFRPVPDSFHIDRLRNMPVGYYFQVIMNGKGKMPSYAAQVPADDRWAIAAYIRVLQQGSRVKMNQLPSDRQEQIRKAMADQQAEKESAASKAHGHSSEEH